MTKIINSNNRFRKNSTAWCTLELKRKYGFFDNNAIRTTSQIVRKIKHKFDKNVEPKHAVRDFLSLVLNDELDRDQIGQGKYSEYIWYLPDISKDHLEKFKKSS
jgi:hypothetical protein